MVLQDVDLNILTKNIVLPTEGIKLQVQNTRAFIGDVEYGKGLLCVAESNLIWKLDNDTGLCLEYPNIALHAVSTDLSAFPLECIYLILDKNIFDNGEKGDDEETEEDDSENITSIRFVPEDKTMLNPLFLAMNDCQALYPDESMSENEDEDEEDDEEGDEELIHEYNESEFIDANTDPNDIQLSERGQQILRRLNINYQVHNENNGDNVEFSSEQYEDAEN